jgi:hypothetical protein
MTWSLETWRYIAWAEFGVLVLFCLVVVLASNRRGR